MPTRRCAAPTSTTWSPSGRFAISPPIAKDNPEKSRTRGRTEKSHALDPVSHTTARGTCWHVLLAYGGHIVERHETDDGKTTLQRLTVISTERIRRSHHYDWYKRVRIICPLESFDHRVPLTKREPAHGRVGDFSIGEYLRQIPRDTPAYEALYPRRSDAESLNRQLEEAFNIRRLPAWGLTRQTAIMLGAALGHNSLSRYLHQTRALATPYRVAA